MIPQDNNALVVASQLPNDVWRRVIAYLAGPETAEDNKALSLVSKQLFTLWREGVLGLNIALERGSNMDFLLEEQFNNFPGLRFVEVSEGDWTPQKRQQELADRALSLSTPSPVPGAYLHLKIQSEPSLLETTELMRQNPRLAERVTGLSLALPSVNAEQVALDDVWALISILPNLVDVEIGTLGAGMTITDAQVAQLLTLPALGRLELIDCQGFTGVGLARLSDTRLTSLSLQFCDQLQGQYLNAISQCAFLEVVKLGGCSQLTGNDLLCLTASNSIKRIDLTARTLCAEDLGVISREHFDLRALSLELCKGLDSEVIEVLMQLPKLQYLCIDSTLRISEDELHRWLATMPALTELVYQGYTESAPQPLGVPLNGSKQPVAITILER